MLGKRSSKVCRPACLPRHRREARRGFMATSQFLAEVRAARHAQERYGMREEFSVPSEMTLLEALREHFPKSSGRKLREMLTEGRVTVVGKASHRAKQQVAAGASIEIHPRDKAAASVRRAERSLKTSRLAILHEDETLLVVDKPPNLLSVATDKMEPDTLHSRALG